MQKLFKTKVLFLTRSKTETVVGHKDRRLCRLFRAPMESQSLSVRFLRQTTGTSTILHRSLSCLRQTPGLIRPPDYLRRPSTIVITVVIEGVRDRREKIDRGRVIATAEEEEEQGAEVETETENGAEAETVAATDIGAAREAERGAPADETRYQTERKCVCQVQKTEKAASHLELSGLAIFPRESAPKKVSKT